jgi:hypothetical protein
MKINKWTMGLAAVGLVSLSSVTQAEEADQPLLTALSSTTISGYVDVSAHWNPGRGIGGYGIGAASKADGFNLNSVLVSLEKPLEEGEWSAGYRADLQYGPDAVAIGGDGTAGNENIRQAYVALRAPVGNGLDIKLGRFDTIIGYESSDGYKNPNYTRSYGWGIEPTTHTGVLATYQALEFLSVNVGVANTLNTGAINGRNTRGTGGAAIDSHKTYMASIALTAPEDLGVLAGSALYAGVIDGFGSSSAAGGDQTSWYVGATIATPVEGLRLGASLDYVQDPVGFAVGTDDIWTAALYASFRATDKLGLNLRGEYVDFDTVDGYAVTATLDYSLWDNVLSRFEARWDHGDIVTGSDDAFLFAANLIYKF